MEYRRLGKSDLMVSEVSFGGHQTGGYKGTFEVPLEERVEVIQRGLDLGITYFDTTIEKEAESLSAVFERMGGKPDGITVAGMYTHYKNNHDVIEGIEDKVRESIDKRYEWFGPVDVFNLCGNGFPYSRERTLRAIDALQEARAQGKVKQFGFSTHTMQYALKMIENHSEFCLIMFPFNVVLPRVAEILFPVAKAHDVAVVDMKAMAARGLFDLDVDPGKYGEQITLPIGAIKWVLQHPEVSCTIPAMNSIAEVEENVRASGPPMTEEEQRMMEAVQLAFEHRVSTDSDWYFYRDWTRRLYGEAEEIQVKDNPFD